MEYHFDVPVSTEKIRKLHVGDIIYVTGKFFTARDEAHHIMLEKDKDSLAFDPSEMALFHCGPLMKKEKDRWQVVSAGPTTSSRMEIFEDKFIEKYGINIIIGKGGMGERTEKALQKYGGVYTAYTGGAGALAADGKRIWTISCGNGLTRQINLQRNEKIGSLTQTGLLKDVL